MTDRRIASRTEIVLSGKTPVSSGLAVRAEQACDAAVAEIRTRPSRARLLESILAGHPAGGRASGPPVPDRLR